MWGDTCDDVGCNGPAEYPGTDTAHYLYVYSLKTQDPLIALLATIPLSLWLTFRSHQLRCMANTKPVHLGTFN